jgi:hypothetical protein
LSIVPASSHISFNISCRLCASSSFPFICRGRRKVRQGEAKSEAEGGGKKKKKKKRPRPKCSIFGRYLGYLAAFFWPVFGPAKYRQIVFGGASWRCFRVLGF